MSIGRDSFLISLRNIAGIIVGFFRSPILVRAYGFLPESFGRLQYLGSTLSVILSYAYLSMSSAYVSERRTHSDIERYDFCSWFMLIAISLACISILVWAAVSQSLVLFIQGSTLAFPRILFDSLAAVARDEKRFSLLALTGIVNLLAATLIALSMGFFIRNEITLIASMSVSMILCSMLLVRKMKWSFAKLRLSSDYAKDFAKSNSNIVLFQTGSSVLNTFSQNVPVFFIGRLFGERILGFYSLAHGLLIKANQLWSSALSQTFLPYFSKSEKDERNIFSNCLLLASVVFFLYFMLSVLSNPYVNILFGADFIMVSSTLKILTPWLFSTAVISPYTSAFLVHHKANVGLAINVILVGSRLGAVLLGSRWGYNISLVFFSLVSVFFFDIMLMLGFRYAKVSCHLTLLVMIVYQASLFVLILSGPMRWLACFALGLDCIILCQRREVLGSFKTDLLTVIKAKLNAN